MATTNRNGSRITKFDPRDSSKYYNKEGVNPVYNIYEYNEEHLSFITKDNLTGYFPSENPKLKTWINLDGLREEVVTNLCAHYDIDYLIVEDIMSMGQRAKYDDLDGQLFFLLPMLRWDIIKNTIVIEQLSIILGSNFLLTFQPEPEKDAFDPIRSRIENKSSNIRKRTIDYLLYTLLDAIVDDYYTIINILSEKVDDLEEEVMNRSRKETLIKINYLKRDWMLMKRQISPVRELVNTIYTMETPLIQESQKKYFKDVLDHISLASEYIDNYRELTVNLQDLYMNQVNTKMNEVIKILTIVTTLLAPFTVIGSIFGMNFDIIPYAHHEYGFYFLILLMFGLSAMMLYYFRRQRWY